MKRLLLFFLSFVGFISSLRSFGQEFRYYERILDARKLLYEKKDYTQAVAAYAAIFQATDDIEPPDKYDAACALAMAGRTQEALAYLKSIIGVSYFNYDYLKKDTLLVALHQYRAWDKLLGRAHKTKLQPLTKAQMYRDFDLLVQSLMEAHTGLFWYNAKPQFDSLCLVLRSKIKRRANVLEFYRIIAPLIGFTKEAHTFVQLGRAAQSYMRYKGCYFPLFVRILDGQCYILNDVGNAGTKGFQLTGINGVSIDSIMDTFMALEPSDGYNISSKYRWIESGYNFNAYFGRCFPMTGSFDIDVIDTATGASRRIKRIPSVSLNELANLNDSLNRVYPARSFDRPAVFSIDTMNSTAVMTLNTFSAAAYRSAGMDFEQFVAEAFQQLRDNQIRNLILDIRKNEGGNEGYEDEVMSYLVSIDYNKFNYVQASAFTYSFYAYSDYKHDYHKLDSIMRTEHYLDMDGRILRKPGILKHAKAKPNPFDGKLVVLTGGLTYSAGATLASLLKIHTDATFVGEEAGGGYHGNTSGLRIVLKLPYSKLEIGIPLLKFVLDTDGKDAQFGHGLIPDYPVQPTIADFMQGHDPVMERAKALLQ
ncbi:S41 family peptidase [Parapedobacter koreensis]|uniref:Peptidase family S41 n=1 Tax=Parapedobacter koreensis TaxID=332977 RepID=A0A1H7Q7H9_9SPHI|nr:S41 family peptidase [Parapedobacter koreensis]SEL43816.1 Peptidase family S41 [Parapedobacter koreensis]